MTSFLLTLVGDDRPGLVSLLSAPISAHGGSWERSQLSRLGGKFAGIVVATVPDREYNGVVADLTALDAVGLQVTVERTDQPDEPLLQRLQLELLGADRPGIVAEVSASLAERRIGIEELTSDLREAPMAGGTLFEATAVLTAPPGTSTDELRVALEGLADELMVEIRLSEE